LKYFRINLIILNFKILKLHLISIAM